ncbi:MAG: hypothetical protein ACJAWS_002613 [Oleiphilaceae bacterium]|jgi:hypothetical protein
MSEFHFKQAGVYHLTRMSTLMRIKLDKRYRLSDDGDVKKLLWDAVSLDERDLISEFILFYIHCWPETQSYICQNKLIPNLDAMMTKVASATKNVNN